MKTRIVPNHIQTIRNILTDLNRMLRNTQAFHQNFVRYGISSKPPYEGSHLVYNVDIDRYQFWLPTKQELKSIVLVDMKNYTFHPRGTIKVLNYVYYPNGSPYIVMLDDVSWIIDLYHSFAYRPDHIKSLSELYGTKLYEYMTSHTNLEREALKDLLTDISNDANQTKALF